MYQILKLTILSLCKAVNTRTGRDAIATVQSTAFQNIFTWKETTAFTICRHVLIAIKKVFRQCANLQRENGIITALLCYLGKKHYKTSHYKSRELLLNNHTPTYCITINKVSACGTLQKIEPVNGKKSN